MGRPAHEIPGPHCGPSERVFLHNVSPRQLNGQGRRIVGNGGLSIPSFKSVEPLGEEAKGGLETNFQDMIECMREGDTKKAIIGMRKLAMLMHGLDEKQLWHGLETLKEICSDSKRGNELRFHASRMLDFVESELWERLGAFADVGMDKGAAPGERANAFKTMEWLYTSLNRLLAERGRPQTAVIGDAEEDGKAGASLPAWNGESVKVAMEEAARKHVASMSAGARKVEKKMAYSILKVVFAGDEVDRAIYESAFHAFEKIDSPILTEMLTKDIEGFELKGAPEGVFPGETAISSSNLRKVD